MPQLYDFTARITCFRQCQALHAVAQECQQVILTDRNGSQANAKSILSLMSLDYSARVRIFASSPQELFALNRALVLSQNEIFKR